MFNKALKGMMDLHSVIRTIPDFPKKGIMFRDITTLFKDYRALSSVADALTSEITGMGISKVAGIDARGFVFGGMIAQALHAGFVPIRKKGKLPSDVYSETYDLEYGTDCLEIHKDAIIAGEKVLLHDDLLATGGTAAAAARLIEQCGGEIVRISFIIELPELNGRQKLEKYDVRSLISFEGE